MMAAQKQVKGLDRKHTFEGTQHTHTHLKLSERNRCNTLPSLSPLLLVQVCVCVGIYHHECVVHVITSRPGQLVCVCVCVDLL